MNKRLEIQNKKKRKKKRMWMTIIFFLMLIGGFLLYMYISLTNFNKVDIEQSNEALGITTPKENNIVTEIEESESEEIVNIALFGVDRRNSADKGRSDAMMIATLDFKHDKIKLTSLMRDMYVPIEGHGQTKLNHAYAYGGAELAIKTINQNFGTDIRDYVTVDFFALESIIDAIGGVEINIKPEEVEYVNKYMQETARIQKKSVIPLEGDGIQELNGMQAVAYARIRYIGNGDFERTDRQRRVLSSMIQKVEKQGNSSIPQLLLKVTPHIETSLSRSDILSLGYEYFKQQPLPIEQERFPMDGDWSSAIINNGWYMKADLDSLKNQITSYIYEDIHPSDEPHMREEPLDEFQNQPMFEINES